MTGSPNSNSQGGGTWTKAQLQEYISQSADNFLNYAVQRNPKVMYQYINQNYPDVTLRFVPGVESNVPAMNTMHDVLVRQYYKLQTNEQKAHMLATVAVSLPAQAQLQNWTTPRG